MSKKNNRFARKYRSLTEIGQIFNLSARVVGKELKRLGYREPDGRPTEEAFSLDLAVSTPLKDGTPHFRWNRAAVIKLLEPYHPRDRDMKIRKIAREMKLIIESEEFECGGGLHYKVAEAILFELADELPVTKNWESIVRVITEEKTSEENRAYMIKLARARLASSKDISAKHVETIFSDEDPYSLELLSENEAVDQVSRERAKALALRLRQRRDNSHDRDMKIRKIVREMKLIIESKEFEDGGGGFDFVVAEATLFELADELPVTKDWESIVRVITEEKTSEENRAYMIELALDRLALSRDISAQHVQTIFSHEDPDSLELLSENEAVDEVSRARAKALASTLRQR